MMRGGRGVGLVLMHADAARESGGENEGGEGKDGLHDGDFRFLEIARAGAAGRAYHQPNFFGGWIFSSARVTESVNEDALSLTDA